MAEKPILFSAPMVKSILDGSKTQTRRVVKGNPAEMVRLMRKVEALDGYDEPTGEFGFCPHPRVISKHVRCPYGQAGGVLWVRETWQTHCDMDGITPRDLPEDAAVQYPATYDHWVSKRRPGIHMPRWASRITLQVTEVRVQRLQDISEEDAKAEGAIRMVVDDENKFYDDDARGSFKCGFCGIWCHLNGAASWDENPWVWVVSFAVQSPSPRLLDGKEHSEFPSPAGRTG